jgi:hypothetical protein
MGEIRDAIDTLTELKATAASAGIYSTKRSISASAMEGTANFPVLVDDSTPIDDSQLISRAAEKKFASFLLTVLTMEPYLEVTKGQTPNAADYLKQFHQNIRVKDATKGMHISLTDFVNESTDVEYTTMKSEAFRLATAIYEGVVQSIPQNINIRCNYTIEEVTSPDTLNSRFRVAAPTMEAGDTFVDKRTHNVNLNTGGGDVKVESPNATVNDKRIVVSPNINVINKMPEVKQQAAVKQNVRDRGAQWKPLTDNDCKKANDLVPTLLHIRVYPVEKVTGEELTPIDFIMGVKATLHPIPVDEIVRMTVAGMRNENIVFNFIRWTTGEIKFFKDFLFAIDSIKMDAKDAGNDVTGWRPALKRRKNASKSVLHVSKNSILPNTSLVISQPTIEYIRDTYGYDLSDERIINRMMNVYFLLGYIIVNPVTQRATFRFDGIDTTDTYTYDTLRRENQSDDKAFKNMMKMLGRSM